MRTVNQQPGYWLQLRMTPQAYEYHVQKAYDLGYIRSERNAQGIMFYIEQLAKLEYTDTRPAFMRDSDLWCDGVNTIRRGLYVAPITRARLLSIAEQFRITPFTTQQSILLGRRVYAPERIVCQAGVYVHRPGAPGAGAYIGATLEAIGLGYLTSIEPVPLAPTNLYATPRRRSIGVTM